MSTDESALKRTDYVALVECGKQLSAEVNINELLQQILNKAAELTDSPDGSVLLYDEERLGLYLPARLVKVLRC